MDLFGEPEPVAEDLSPVEPEAIEPEEEGFLSAQHVQPLYGFEAPEQHLLKLYNENRIPHGLVFSGLKGVGKAAFAYRLSRFLLKHGVKNTAQDDMFGDVPAPTTFDVSEEDSVSRYIAQGAHPELMSVEAEKSGVNVEAVRKIAPFLRMTASNGGWRIVIVDDADTMNRAAQNAILKILEEPPKNTLVILICHRLGALIPTIRSRTQVMSFEAPSYDVFVQILKGGGYALSEEQYELLFQLSDGSIGKTLSYIEKGGLDTLTKLLGAFEGWPNLDMVGIHALAEEASRSNQDNAYGLFSEVFRWVFDKLCLAKARGAALDGQIWERPVFHSLLSQKSLKQLLDIQSQLHAHFLKVDHANLDKRTGVLRAFSIVSA